MVNVIYVIKKVAKVGHFKNRDEFIEWLVNATLSFGSISINYYDEK